MIVRTSQLRAHTNHVQWRGFSTIRSTPGPSLYSQVMTPPNMNPEKNPTLVMHGLFGSHQNWRAIGKRLAANTSAPVHLIDLRNHGESPHTPDHSYDLMSEDVLRYIDSINAPKANLIGHSMGGKVVMNLALREPEIIEKLVVVDISPINYKDSFKKFSDYIDIMKGLDLSKIKNRKQADDAIAPFVTQYTLRQFLLTNLRDISKDPSTPSFDWKINLEALAKSMPDIRDFPQQGERVFRGPTLFLGGADSRYIASEYEETMRKLFPLHTTQFIGGAGHWVQAEKPEEFIKIVSAFLKGETE
ncbi:abhydrolase domain-containing protein 11-like [Planoprotostelium fungivorum]|uniref:Abhydrolase domain-containing protein 11-like n=1 Tax=Planoprotostelium fungivorum TaxID=1890364 RepID=A0A2P6N801_9EUKA|nr:abhydrolase domain-containing protein 11-like [Planoprotostelium fungivorum]